MVHNNFLSLHKFDFLHEYINFVLKRIEKNSGNSIYCNGVFSPSYPYHEGSRIRKQFSIPSLSHSENLSFAQEALILRVYLLVIENVCTFYHSRLNLLMNAITHNLIKQSVKSQQRSYQPSKGLLQISI